MSSPEMLSPRKDPITNQYSTIIITHKNLILPPLLENCNTLYKPLCNDTNFSNGIEEEHNDYTNNSRTENKDYIKNINVKIMKKRIINTKEIIKKLLKLMKV